MAKATFKFCAKGAKMAATPAKPGAKAAGDLFTITDLGGGKLTVTGHDAAGAGGIVLDGIATLTFTSSDPTVATCDPPVGATCQVKGVKPGAVDITIVATATDGSWGPVTADVTGTVTQGPTTGLDVAFSAS